MAEYGDSGHKLGGTTPQQRYREAGVSCQYSGENAAKTWYRTEVREYDKTRYYANTSQLARGLISQWLRSEPHKEIMLSEKHSAVGVGVSMKEEKEGWAVYAILDFCA
jgi:uncharacterized protein YkwD